MNYLISFGDDILYKYQKLRLRKEAKSTGWFDQINIISPENLIDFFKEHKNFIEKNPKGHGCWIWKPHIILDQLHKINYGDFLFYIDSGGSILSHKKSKFDEYLDLLNNSNKPILAFADGESLGKPPLYKEKLFQKMRILKRFNLENNEDFLNSGHVEGGVFICKKCDFVMNFVQEWMDLVLENDYSLVNEEDDFSQSKDFKEHRHDQSILSVLCKINKVNILGIDHCYGKGPFFSSRQTDKGSKKLAPDGFRKEPDYDQTKHYNWDMYLKDNEIKEKTINYIKNLFISAYNKLNFYNIDFDLKNELLKLIIPEIERIQFNKGIYKIKITIDEFSFLDSISKERLLGEFCCDFIMGDNYTFNFDINPNNISFPIIKPIEKKLYKFEYIRTWDAK